MPDTRPRPARRRRGALSEEERALWQDFAAAVRPLAGRAPVVPPPVPAAAADPTPPPPVAAPTAPPVARAVAPVAVGGAPGGLDKATWQRLRSGRLEVERRLDLHGRTAERAHHALRAFLQQAQAEQVRCVEVITGRGAGEAGGVLRRELPEWLNAPDIRPMVLAAVHPHARNVGAVRILLRRKR